MAQAAVRKVEMRKETRIENDNMVMVSIEGKVKLRYCFGDYLSRAIEKESAVSCASHLRYVSKCI